MLHMMALGLAVLATSGGALAAASSPEAVYSMATFKPVTSFGYLDADKDARVSHDEAKADWAVAQGFSHADINHDGYLDKDEFAKLGRG